MKIDWELLLCVVCIVVAAWVVPLGAYGAVVDPSWFAKPFYAGAALLWAEVLRRAVNLFQYTIVSRAVPHVVAGALKGMADAALLQDPDRTLN